jgi:hypothetical protein
MSRLTRFQIGVFTPPCACGEDEIPPGTFHGP